MLRLLGGKKRPGLVLGLVVGTMGVVLLGSQAQGAQSANSTVQDMGLVLTSQAARVVLDPFTLRTVQVRSVAAARTVVLGSQSVSQPVMVAGTVASVAGSGPLLRNPVVRIPHRPLLASPYQVGH